LTIVWITIFLTSLLA